MSEDVNIEQCILCNNKLQSETVTVKEKGLLNIRACSIKRGDGIASKLNDVTILSVHVKCRKDYINEKIINAFVKRKLLQNACVDVFDYKTNCLFCSKDASDDYIRLENKKPEKLRSGVTKIRMAQTKVSITDMASQRNDSSGENFSVADLKRSEALTWHLVNPVLWADITDVVDDVANRVSFNEKKYIYKILRRIQDVDLVAVGARYHRTCYNTFRLTEADVPLESLHKRGRPETDATNSAMNDIYRYLEEHGEECQFSLIELKNIVSHECPDDRTIKRKLKEKYGDALTTSSIDGKSTLFCFRDTGNKILRDAWYNSRLKDNQQERLRIVQTAASIILEDIKSTAYDTSVYPPLQQFHEKAEAVIPPSLKVFLEQLIEKDKKDKESASRKSIAIAHAIITAVRPRSFTSSVLLSIAALINQKYAAKSLIQLLASLGFSLSYHEASLFQISAIAHHTPEEIPDFCQYVFDNADHNVNTIDGHNTFHSMGGIKCHTPAIKNKDEGIIRLKNIPPSFVVGNFGHVSLENYEAYGKKGLKQVPIHNFATDSDIKDIFPLSTDILWLYSKKEGFPDVPGWNGYMERLNANKEFKTSEVIPFPFINNPPTQYDTIYTAILMAVENTKSIGLESTIITFDQPLYQKAKDISTSSEDPRLKSVIIRLGGFHLLMSYMGGIGYIMQGSGLKELWSTVYAPSSVEMLLSGHAYSRAVRAHTLTHLSLGKKILDKVEFDDEDITILEDKILTGHYEEILDGAEELKPVMKKIKDVLQNTAANGPTAKLWVLYFKMVTLVKQFIHAERSGDWQMHLASVKKMLPFFHASGHFAYAKSATLYLQDMDNLENVLTPDEYNKFSKGGNFTVRRTDKFWSGIWTDMTIEQTLMRSMKSSGGLTHGRGLTDSVLTKWILATPTLSQVSSSIEEFGGVSSASSEQHVDSRACRKERDSRDVEKFDKWFDSHDPFLPLDKIMSLSSGITGGADINCHEAQKIGIDIMFKTESKNFQDISYSRKDRVLPLAAVNSSIKVDDIKVPIEPEMIFRRIAFAKKSQQELKEYLKFELAPFPLSLYDENGMRKGKKSAFYELFKPTESEPATENRFYVLDGGYILHKVVWRKGVTFSAVCDQYVKYIIKHFGANSTVVFDGYPDNLEDTSTKTAERHRRKKCQMSPEILFNEKTMVMATQEKFLGNEKNKKRLIELLMAKLENSAIKTKQSKEDADTLIISTALENADHCDSVVVVGEDIDLLVILTGRSDSRKSKVYFMKPARGNIEKKIYSSTSFIERSLSDHVLFMHAFSGCDTTSAIFRQGKKKIVELMKKNTQLQNLCLNFRDPNAERDLIISCGEKVMTHLYSSNTSSKKLDDIRYELFARSITKSKFNLACLPPTSGAAQQHSLRTYCQVQCWLGENKLPEHWGWKKSERGLASIATRDDPAPQEILSVISCKCKTTCGRNCTCQKAALKCSVVCSNCSGKPCTGVAVLDESAEPDQDEAEIERSLTVCTDSGQPYDSDMDSETEVIRDIDMSDDDNKENYAIDDVTTNRKKRKT